MIDILYEADKEREKDREKEREKDKEKDREEGGAKLLSAIFSKQVPSFQRSSGVPRVPTFDDAGGDRDRWVT